MVKSLSLLVFLVLCTQACAQKRGNLLTSDQLVELMIKKDVVLVDIRTPKEFMWGYIEGAINIDYYDF